EMRPVADSFGAAFNLFATYKYLQALSFDEGGAVSSDPEELARMATFGLAFGDIGYTAAAGLPGTSGLVKEPLPSVESARGEPLEPVTTGSLSGARSIHPNFDIALATHSVGPSGKLVPKTGSINIGGEYETPTWSNLNANINDVASGTPRFGPGAVQNWVPGYAEE